MANAKIGNHLYFDGVGSVSGRLRIIFILWGGIDGKEIADDADLSITDTAGKVILNRRATAALDGIQISPSVPLEVDGLSVVTLDSGVLHIWLEDGVYNSGPAYLK